MIDPATRLPVSDTNGSHPDKVLEELKTSFGRIIASDIVPKDTILLLPHVTLEEHLNVATGEVKQYFSYDPKTGGIISNVKS